MKLMPARPAPQTVAQRMATVSPSCGDGELERRAA